MTESEFLKELRRLREKFSEAYRNGDFVNGQKIGQQISKLEDDYKQNQCTLADVLYEFPANKIIEINDKLVKLLMIADVMESAAVDFWECAKGMGFTEMDIMFKMEKAIKDAREIRRYTDILPEDIQTHFGDICDEASFAFGNYTNRFNIKYRNEILKKYGKDSGDGEYTVEG